MPKAVAHVTPALTESDVLDWALVDLPRSIPDIVRVLMEDPGEEMAEEFITRMLAALGGTAVAALGKERACEMVATQLAATEQL